MRHCKVIISNSSQSFSGKLDCLTYSIPTELEKQVNLGSFVNVPLGKAQENALVIDFPEPQEAGNFKIKSLEEIITEKPVYQKELIELIKFTAEYYCCNFEEVLNAALPSGIIKKPELQISLQEITLDPQLSQNTVVASLNKARKQTAKFTRLKTLTKMGNRQLRKEIDKLAHQGIVCVEYLSSQNTTNSNEKNPLDRLQDLDSKLIPELTTAQQQSIDHIKQHSNSSQKFLLHGVTGSGKTEVYLRLIEEAFKQNKSSLVLVPEIALTPQITERIAQRFGKENVLLWHSALNSTEKEFTWNELVSGKAKVVIGARSAIWSPIQNLGLIIMDEEHENTYKQESPNPRYDARKLAIKRSELNNCPLVFGSATPSLDIYHKASSDLEIYQDYHLLELKDRVFKNPLPEVSIIDMREEFLNGNKSVFSRKLHGLIENSLNNEEQVILFLNKRGSASHVFCRTCGYVYECKHCDSKMVYHQDLKQLICHHCGDRANHPEECPECSMPTIKFFGLGTKRLEEETQKIFPEARIARLDSDSSRIGHNYLKIWQDFKDGNIDILIGTQMIAKGLDLKNLSTVGVISADINFSQVDYLADEKGFQLLTQVAGRTGRGDKEGHVVFQSYQPERGTLQTAQNHDYNRFYQNEISERQDFNYPPFSTLIRFVSASENQVNAIETANQFHEAIYKIPNIQVLGPCPCVMAKLNRKHRYHLQIKIPRDVSVEESKDINYQNTINSIKEAYKAFKPASQTSFTIDIDNHSLY